MILGLSWPGLEIYGYAFVPYLFAIIGLLGLTPLPAFIPPNRDDRAEDKFIPLLGRVFETKDVAGNVCV